MTAFHTTVELESHKRDDSGQLQRWMLISVDYSQDGKTPL